MTKLQTWTAVQDIIAAHNIVDPEFEARMADLLAPKKAGGSVNPPVLDEEGNILEAWCRYHQAYEPADDMVITNNKSKGYCKAAASISNTRRKDVQAKRLEALSIMGDDIEKAQGLVKEANELEPQINGVEFYDLESDWEQFNSTTAK